MKEKKLIRKQIDKSLRRLLPLRGIFPPKKSWISIIRKALGMSARQLAVRMGVSQQRVAQIEKQEPDSSLTIKAMRRVAEQLDCQFVYGFVPTNNSLEATVYNQVKQVALRRISRVSHTMSLEDQALTKKENEELLSDMIEELLNDQPSNLWDKT